MSIEVADGTLRISVGHSVKVGRPNYSAEDAHYSVSFEQAVEGGDIIDILKFAEQVEAMLEGHVKLSVAASLGLEMNGTEFVFPQPAAKPAAPQRRSSSSGGSGGGGGGPSKLADQPVYTIDGIDYYDQRSLKADGTYSPKAPDFKEVGKSRGGSALWIKGADGTVNEGVTEKLKAAGIDFEV